MNAATGPADRAAAPAGNSGRTAPPPLRQQRMLAIVQAGDGSADILHAEEIDQPAAGDGEVLVRVRAAGLDRGTWHLMAGQPYLVRLVSGLRTPKNRVPGLDVAGTVVAAAAGVTRFKAGDEVFGIGQGSFAEYARARADKLARKPANLTFGQAAAVAVSGLTALQGLHDTGRLQPGQHVLITGASGVSAPLPCRSPGPWVRRSLGCAAPRRPAWSPRSAPTTSSTTRATTSPTAPTATT